MVDINLKTGQDAKVDKVKWGKSMPLSLGILVFLLVIYGGLVFSEGFLNGKISEEENIYQEKTEDLRNGNAVEVIDFQNRLLASESLLQNDPDNVGSLSEIESLVVPGVYLNSLEYDEEDKSIKVVAIGSDFRTVAEQILVFKNSEYFSKVTAGETSIEGETGFISFPVELTIK